LACDLCALHAADPVGFPTWAKPTHARGVGKLKTAKGYEEWLKRAEEIARKRKRQG